MPRNKEAQETKKGRKGKTLQEELTAVKKKKGLEITAEKLFGSLSR